MANFIVLNGIKFCAEINESTIKEFIYMFHHKTCASQFDTRHTFSHVYICEIDEIFLDNFTTVRSILA